MFKMTFAMNRASVMLDSNSGNSPALVVWDGETALIENAKADLALACGAFGHIFDTEFTTPIDLHAAMVSSCWYMSPEVVEGAELVETYDPNIPDDAVT